VDDATSLTSLAVDCDDQLALYDAQFGTRLREGLRTVVSELLPPDGGENPKGVIIWQTSTASRASVEKA